MTGKLFYHVSTDEVYGSLGETGFLRRQLLMTHEVLTVQAKQQAIIWLCLFHTYHLPVIISNCSNNYGPNHFPEKLIPLSINNIIQKNLCLFMGKAKMYAIGCM